MVNYVILSVYIGLKNLELDLEFIFHKNPYLTVTFMLNHRTGIKAIRPQLARLNLRS